MPDFKMKCVYVFLSVCVLSASCLGVEEYNVTYLCLSMVPMAASAHEARYPSPDVIGNPDNPLTHSWQFLLGLFICLFVHFKKGQHAVKTLILTYDAQCGTVASS